MKSLKYIILTLIFIFLGLTSFQCSIDNTTNVEEDDFKKATSSDSKTISIQSQTKLNLEGINGQIQIKGKDNLTQMTIEIEKIAKAESQEEANEALSRMSVKISEQSDLITVQSNHPTDEEGITHIVNYTIQIPNNWQVDIYQYNGTVKFDSLFCDTQLELFNGLVSLDNMKGKLDVTLLNGEIETDISISKNDMCKQSITNGNMLVKIPKSTSAKFDAHVSNGTIQVSGLDFESMESNNHFVKGCLNGGNGEIDLDVGNGTLKVLGYE